MTEKSRIHAHAGAWARSRVAYGCAVAAVILVGLGVRHPGLGLPWPLAKYAGSVLWGTMVHFIVAFAAPKAGVFARAAAASCVALLVELLRLYSTPWLDEFRMTTAGGLLLGRVFSVWNVAAYWLGILGGALVERLAVRGDPRRR